MFLTHNAQDVELWKDKFEFKNKFGFMIRLHRSEMQCFVKYHNLLYYIILLLLLKYTF